MITSLPILQLVKPFAHLVLSFLLRNANGYGQGVIVLLNL